MEIKLKWVAHFIPIGHMPDVFNAPLMFTSLISSEATHLTVDPLHRGCDQSE